jgi:hypothetical protein
MKRPIALRSASSSRRMRTAPIAVMQAVRCRYLRRTRTSWCTCTRRIRRPQWTCTRDAFAPVFADLNKYDATTHFVGQSTILTLTDDRATGEAYCLAHHVTVDGGKRRLMVASIRYQDTFVKIEGAWLFAERRLYVDWIDERPLS